MGESRPSIQEDSCFNVHCHSLEIDLLEYMHKGRLCAVEIALGQHDHQFVNLVGWAVTQVEYLRESRTAQELSSRLLRVRANWNRYGWPGASQATDVNILLGSSREYCITRDVLEAQSMSWDTTPLTTLFVLLRTFWHGNPR